jgi:hypothetical protein
MFHYIYMETIYNYSSCEVKYIAYISSADSFYKIRFKHTYHLPTRSRLTFSALHYYIGQITPVLAKALPQVAKRNELTYYFNFEPKAPA